MLWKFVLVFLAYSLLTDSLSLNSNIEVVKEQNLNDTGLGKIYMINLDSRKDRLEAAQVMFDYFKLPFTRFAAISGANMKRVVENGEKIDLGLHPDTKIDLFGIQRQSAAENRTMLYNRVSCWQSHLQVYFEIVASANKTGVDKPVLVLEDDNLFEENLFEEIKNNLKELPSDWDMLAVGYCYSTCQITPPFSQKTCLSARSHCANGYVLRNAASTAKLISYSNKPNEQIADLLWIAHQSNDFKLYLVRPLPLVIQDRSRFGSDLIVGLDVSSPLRTKPGYLDAVDAVVRKYAKK